MRTYATALSLAIGVALVLYPMLKVEEPGGILAIGLTGLAFLALSLSWSRARALHVGAVILIALHYALALHSAQVGLDAYSVLVALGLFLVYELADLSIAHADVAGVTRPALAHRAATTVAIAAAGALLAVLGVLARSLFSSGVAGLVLGTLCALGLVALALLLAATDRPRRSQSYPT